LDSTNSKDRILEAALKLFSEQGFNGTSVKEIAAEADVSKALIYYNFESKEAILLELLNTFKQEFKQVFKRIYEKDDYDGYYGRWEPKEIEDGLKFFIEKRRIWIVLILESLKTTTGKESLIQIWDELNATTRKKMLNDRGFTIQGDLTKDIVDLFFILIPVIFYAVFHEDWMKLHGEAEAEKVSDSFTYILNTIYNNFLRENTGVKPE
jgi:AcrR family transcriptional regulator